MVTLLMVDPGCQWPKRRSGSGRANDKPYSCIKNMAKCQKTHVITTIIEFCSPFLDLTTGELEDFGHFIAMFFTKGKPESSRSFVAGESQ